MSASKKQIKILVTSIILTLTNTFCANSQTITYTSKSIDSIAILGFSLYKQQPNEAIKKFNDVISYGKQYQDSFALSTAYNGLGLAYDSKSEYAKSFESYYKSIDYLKTIDEPIIVASVYNNLGLVYSNNLIYEKALEMYTKSEALINENIALDSDHLYNLTLLNIAMVHRNMGKYEIAAAYVEKSLANIDQSKTLKPFVKNLRTILTNNEKGISLAKLGENQEALALTLAQKPKIDSIGDAYLQTLNSFYLAEIYSNLKNSKRAVSYVEKGLAFVKKSEDKALKRDAYILSERIYAENGNNDKAYSFLKKKIALESDLFNAQQIWALYDKNKAIENLQQQNTIEKVAFEEKTKNLLVILYSILVVFVLIGSILFFYNLRKKHKKEQQYALSLQEATKEELDKTKEILEIKRRELTTAALQIIERGEQEQQFKEELDEIKTSLKIEHHNKIDKLAAGITNSNQQNWESFRSRFEQVNTEFFANLRATYPNLTPSEMKLCSFLKLNFNSKDIANLLGISPNSVKVSRYRLRKKMDLSREQNLVEHVNKF